MSDISGTVRPTNFKLSTQIDHDDPRHSQVQCPPRSNPNVTRSCDQSDACRSITRERKAVETPKLVGRFSHDKRNIVHQFQGQKVKCQGHRRSNCDTQNA